MWKNVTNIREFSYIDMKCREFKKKTYLEWAHKSFINAHHAAGVIELPAVVGGGEQGHQLTLGEELVPVLNNLNEVWFMLKTG